MNPYGWDYAVKRIEEVSRYTDETAAKWTSETVKPGTVAPPLRSDSCDEYLSETLPPGSKTG